MYNPTPTLPAPSPPHSWQRLPPHFHRPPPHCPDLTGWPHSGHTKAWYAPNPALLSMPVLHLFSVVPVLYLPLHDIDPDWSQKAPDFYSHTFPRQRAYFPDTPPHGPALPQIVVHVCAPHTHRKSLHYPFLRALQLQSALPALLYVVVSESSKCLPPKPNRRCLQLFFFSSVLALFS